MTYFVLQTCLMLIVAFVMGASLGCMVRSFFLHGEDRKAVATPDPQAGGGQAETSDAGAPTVSGGGEAATAGSAAHALVEPAGELDEAAGSATQAAAGDELDAVADEPATEPEPELAADENVQPSSDVGAGATAAAAAAIGAAGAGVVATNEEPATPPGGETGAALAESPEGPLEAVAAVGGDQDTTDAAGEVDTTATSPVTAPPAGPPDDLTEIQGIDGPLLDKLSELGVSRFSQIAQWTGDDISRIGAEIGDPGRISRGNWIEQAAILAAGGQTLFTRRRANGAMGVAPSVDQPASSAPEIASTAAPETAGKVAGAPPADEAASPPEAGAALESLALDPSQATGPMDASIAAAAAAAAAATATTSVGREASESVDEAETPPNNGSGNAMPVVEAAAVATGSPDPTKETDVESVGAVQPSPTETPQANDVANKTITSAAEAAGVSGAGMFEDVRQRTEGLRSVRSQALRGGTEPTTGGGRVLRSAEPDDLKRVRGVGVVIEKKLNAMGITSYEQIAAWTDADIEEVSKRLDFKGRIERENWIEQARILANSGQTEFSRRVDNGEFENDTD